MHTFPKKAKRENKNEKWTTFARIHSLTCQRNTLPCAPSILKHRVSAEVYLLGHQWISRGFTLRKFRYHQCTRSRKIHWTMITQELTEDLQIDLFPRNVPAPPKKNRFIFGLGRSIRGMLSIFRDDRSTTLSTRMGLFRVPSRSTKTCQAQTNNKLSAIQKSIFLGGERNMTGQNTSSPNVYRTFLGKKLICPESSINNIKAS